MIFDLFSSFDGSFFLFALSVFLIFCVSLNFTVSGYQSLFSYIVYNIYSTIYSSGSTKFFNLYSLLISVFCCILILNFFGMLPYVFSVTSHIIWVMVWSLSIWWCIFLSSFMFNFCSSLSHFVPQASPLALGGFLSFIELFSNIIRPLTLCLRLGINITTGHVFLCLLGLGGSLISSIILAAIGCMYFIFEIGICLVQSLVFSLLLVQYTDEHSSV